MTKSRKAFGILKIIAALIVLAAAAVIAGSWFFDINRFRPELETQLSEALGREVTVGRLKLDLFTCSLTAEGIRIADSPAFGPSPFVQAKALRIGVELKPLIASRALRITGISLEEPSINLACSSSGKWNFSDLASGRSSGNRAPRGSPVSSSAMDISINRLNITGGRVTVTGHPGKSSSYENVTVAAGNLSLTSEFPFSLTASLPGKGKLELKGKAGPLNQVDMLRTPLAADISVSHFDLVASGFAPQDSGIAGLINFSGAVNSDGNKARSEGNAAAGNLQIAKNGAPATRPINLRFVLEHDLKLKRGTLRDAVVECGNAAANLSGNYDVSGKDLVLGIKARGSGMPLQDLQTLLPAFGVTLPKGASLEGGALDVEMAADGPVENMVIAGAAQISRTRLVGFDLAGKMAVVAALAGLKSKDTTEIEKFLSRARLTREGTQVSELRLIVPDLGEFTGGGMIAPDRSLDLKMNAALNPPGGIARGLARLAGGTLHVPFYIRGTAADPKFVPDVKGAAGGLLRSAIPGTGAKNRADGGGDLNNTLRNLLRKEK